jgi:hypothetical protein
MDPLPVDFEIAVCPALAATSTASSGRWLTLRDLADKVEEMASTGHVLMSESEIAAGCRRLGLPRPSTLPNAGPGAAAVDDHPSANTPLVNNLLTTLASPLVVVFAHRQETGSVAEMAVFALSESWAVEQIAQPGSVYSLTLFPGEEQSERVIGFCRLSDRSASGAVACELTGRGFLEAMEKARADPAGAVGLLRVDGLGTSAARSMVEVLAACERRAQVTVARRTEAGRIDGSTAAWLDAGGHGLWRIGAPMLATSGDYGDYGEALLERATVTLAPTTRANILDEINQGFPNGW